MKKILSLIITSSLICASIFTANAQEGYLEKLLDLNSGIESYELSLPEMQKIQFQNANVQKTYDEFLSIDTILRSEITKKYRAGELTQYQMQDLINSYENFVYYTEKTFYYISLEEKGFRGRDTEQAILSGYTKMRSNYVKVQNIIK